MPTIFAVRAEHVQFGDLIMLIGKWWSVRYVESDDLGVTAFLTDEVGQPWNTLLPDVVTVLA